MDPVYSSHRFPGSLADATAALDLLVAERRGHVGVEVEGGSLWFAASDALFTLEGRRFRALVSVGRWRRVPVEIELKPWSAGECELVVRLGADRVPVARRRFFTVMSAAARRLGEQVDRRIRLCLDRAA